MLSRGDNEDQELIISKPIVQILNEKREVTNSIISTTSPKFQWWQDSSLPSAIKAVNPQITELHSDSEEKIIKTPVHQGKTIQKINGKNTTGRKNDKGKQRKIVQEKVDSKSLTRDSTKNKQNTIQAQNGKSRYGYTEQYDLIQAEKHLSKRRTDIKYDNTITYGKATAIESNATASKKINTNNDINHNDDNKGKGKDEEDDDDNDEDDNENVKNRRNILDDDEINKRIEKRRRLQREKELNETNQNDSDLGKVGDSKHHLKNDIDTDKKQNKLQPNTKPDFHSNYAETDSNRPLWNKNNKNFAVFFNSHGDTNLKETSIGGGGWGGGSNGDHDEFSCDQCEPIYKASIMYNIPLKVLKCLNCGNILNNVSLRFYLNKYKYELLEQGRTKLKNSKIAGTNNINTDWGNWINANKSKVQEDLVYNVADGKIKLGKKQTEKLKDQVQNTQLEEVFNRKTQKKDNNNNNNKKECK